MKVSVSVQVMLDREEEIAHTQPAGADGRGALLDMRIVQLRFPLDSPEQVTIFATRLYKDGSRTQARPVYGLSAESRQAVMRRVSKARRAAREIAEGAPMVSAALVVKKGSGNPDPINRPMCQIPECYCDGGPHA